MIIDGCRNASDAKSAFYTIYCTTLVLRNGVTEHNVRFVGRQTRLCVFTKLTRYIVPFYSRKIIASEFNETRPKYSLFCPNFSKPLSKFGGSMFTKMWFGFCLLYHSINHNSNNWLCILHTSESVSYAVNKRGFANFSVNSRNFTFTWNWDTCRLCLFRSANIPRT